jgi:hypothetical protein
MSPFVAFFTKGYTIDQISGNKEASAKIDKAIKEAKSYGVDLINPTPQKLIPIARVEVCKVIIESVPDGIFLEPIAGGMTILLLNVGLDVFCGWVKDKVTMFEAEEYSEQNKIKREIRMNK